MNNHVVTTVHSHDLKNFGDMFIASVSGSDDDGFDLNVLRVDPSGQPAMGWAQDLKVNWMQPPVEQAVLSGRTTVGNSRSVTASGEPYASNKQVGVCFARRYETPPMVFASISDTSGDAAQKQYTFASSIGWVNTKGFGANVMAFDASGAAQPWKHSVVLNWIVPNDNADHVSTPPAGEWPLPFAEAANLMSQDVVGTSHSAPFKSTTVCFGNTFAYDSAQPIIIATTQYASQPAVPGELDDLFASSVGWTCSPHNAETDDGGNCNGFNLNTIRVPTTDGAAVTSWGQQLEVNWLAAPVQRGVQAGQVVVGNVHPSQSTQRANATVEFKFDNGYTFPAPPLVLVTVHNELGSDHPDVFAASVSSVSTTGFRVNIARLDVVDAGWGQVSFLLCTVTFYANLADSLTRSPNIFDDITSAIVVLGTGRHGELDGGA